MRTLLLSLVALAFAAGCTPTIRVEPSDKPITINMNVKIEHEIKLKVDKDLDKAMSDNGDLF